MLGSGKSSGMVNEAGNLLANQNLTATIEQMATQAYQKSRDLSDVIPTHRHEVSQSHGSKSAKENLPPYDPTMEKLCTQIERGGLAELEEDDEDSELLELRRMRMQKMKHQRDLEAAWRGKQHGEYREIGQDDFFNVVVREKGGSERCCVHFYHKDFETCKVMDSRLSELARQIMGIRFVKIDAEKAPFLVERLRVTTLPCCLLFKDDICLDRIVGYEGCVNEDGVLDAELLKERIERTLNYNNEATV